MPATTYELRSALLLGMLRYPQHARAFAAWDSPEGLQELREAVAGWNPTPATLTVVELTESLHVTLMEAGFTGSVRDSLGRTYHYQDGKRISAAKAETTGLHNDPPKDASKAEAVLERVKAYDELTPEHLATLAEHLPALTVPRLRAARVHLNARLGGAKNKQEMIDRLRAFVRDKMGAKPEGAGTGVEEPKTEPASEPPEEKATALAVGDRVKQQVLGIGGRPITIEGVIEKSAGGKMYVRTEGTGGKGGGNVAMSGGDIKGGRYPLNDNWLHADDFDQQVKDRKTREEAAAATQKGKEDSERDAEQKSVADAVASGDVPLDASKLKPGDVVTGHHRGIRTEYKISGIDPKFGPTYENEFGGESVLGKGDSYTMKPGGSESKPAEVADQPVPEPPKAEPTSPEPASPATASELWKSTAEATHRAKAEHSRIVDEEKKKLGSKPTPQEFAASRERVQGALEKLDDALASHNLVARLVKQKFSGTDAQGREWADGKLVAKGEETAAEPTKAAPAPTKDHLEDAVTQISKELHGERYASTGLVPIHDVREAIRRKFGDAAASPEVFNEILLGMRRSKKAKLLSISDRSQATKDQLNSSINAVGETFFYLDMEPTPTATSEPSAPAKATPSTAHAIRGLYDRSGDTSIPYSEVESTLASLDTLAKPDLLPIASTMELRGMASKSAAVIRKEIKQKVLDRRSSAQREKMMTPKDGEAEPKTVAAPAPTALPSDDDLASATVEPLKVAGAGAGAGGALSKVTHNGQSYFFKNARGDEASREHATADLAAMAGVGVPMARVAKVGGKDGILTAWADGTSADKDKAAFHAAVKSDPAQATSHAAFNFLVGAEDRHGGNYIVGGDGRISSIDHSDSVPKSRSPSDAAELMGQDEILAAMQTAQGGGDIRFHPEGLASVVSKIPDMAANLRSRGMEREAAGLEARGRVLAALAKDANPTESRLAALAKGAK